MSIQSRIHVLWGVFGLLVSLLLLSLSYGAMAMERPPVTVGSPASEPAHSSIVRSNLQTIGYALATYRANNNDDLPPRLSMLFPDYVSDPTVFWSPGDTDACPTTIDNDEPDGVNSAQVSFRYFSERRFGTDPYLVLSDNTFANNNGTGVYGVRLDGMIVRYFEPTPNPPAWTQTARSRLQQLGAALASYAQNHQGKYPDKLSRLYGAYVSDPSAFWNPGDWRNTVPPETIDNDWADGLRSSQISFDYLGGGYTSACGPGTILLQDNSPSNNGGATVNILTADMNVATCIQSVSCNHPLVCRAVDQQNLDSIMRSVLTYADANKGSLPPDLTMIWGRSEFDPATFWSMGDSDPCPLRINNNLRNATESTQISYAYFPGKTGTDELAVVLHDHTLSHNAGAGLNVAPVDMAVEFFEPSARFLPSTATALANLQQIGQALQAYAGANGGHYPDALSRLYPAYVSSAVVFWNPGDKNTPPTAISSDTPNGGNSAQISYNYLGSGYSVGCDPGVVLLADNSLANNRGVGICVLTAGGQAAFFAPAPPSCQYHVNCVSIAGINLRRIAVALHQYALDNRDILPTRFSMLYPKYLPRPSTFWNPGDVDEPPLTIDNDVIDQPTSAQVSFEYLAAGRDLSELGADDILLRDNSPANNNGNGINVAFADTRVEYMPLRVGSTLALSGPDAVPEGGTAQFTCTVTYDDGTARDVTSSCIPYRLTGVVGGFEPPTKYTAPSTVLRDEPVTLAVRYIDESRKELEASKTFTVQNTIRILTDVAITAGPATVGEGQTAAYTCTATYDDGGTQDVTAQAVWSVSSGPGSFSSAGTYAAPVTVTVDVPATIRASFSHDGVSKETTKQITVLNTKRILTGLTIASGPNTVAEGASAAYTCRATYDDGTFEDATAAATWSVTAGPGSFSATGTYTAPATVLADTSATIRASYARDGITRQATRNITVLNSVRILASLSISSGPAVVPEGGTGAYVCTALYDDGATQTVTDSAVWSVTAGPGSFAGPGTYAAPASVTASTPATLQASYAEGGVTKTATKDIMVNNGIRRLSSVTIASGPAIVAEGGSAAYTCTALYDDNTTQNVTTSATWYLLENTGAFLVPGTYSAPASVLADTPVVLYVLYAEGGLSRQASKSITVLNSVRKLAGLAITSSPSEVSEGGSAELVCTATYDDGGSEAVTGGAHWTVTDGVGAFTAPGTYAAPATVLADTTVKVSASYTRGGVSKQAVAQFMVRNTVRVLVSLAVTSGPVSLQAGATAAFTCAATYDDGSTQPVTSAATWSIVSGSGSFGSGGEFTAPASVSSALSVIVKATYTESGVQREASRGVRIDPPPAADADGDGVPDSRDACPFTPSGAAVDASGCAAAQRDSDGDGVSDDVDACPGTPAGMAVAANGCPLSDRDSDSVPDASDNCPDLDNVAQADRDRDGRGDACDLCPDDAAKTTPGACGCGVPETPGCGTAAVYTVRVVTSEGAPVPYTYNAGTWAEIAAPAASEGMRFSHWSGDYSGTESVARLLVDGDKQLIANYEDCPEATVPPCGSGVPGCGLTAMLALLLVKRRFVERV